MHMLSHVEFDMCIWINSLDDTGIFWINSLDDTGINIYPISATAKLVLFILSLFGSFGKFGKKHEVWVPFGRNYFVLITLPHLITCIN